MSVEIRFVINLRIYSVTVGKSQIVLYVAQPALFQHRQRTHVVIPKDLRQLTHTAQPNLFILPRRDDDVDRARQHLSVILEQQQTQKALNPYADFNQINSTQTKTFNIFANIIPTSLIKESHIR